MTESDTVKHERDNDNITKNPKRMENIKLTIKVERYIEGYIREKIFNCRKKQS